MKYFSHLVLLKNISGLGLAKINARWLNVISNNEDYEAFADHMAEELGETSVGIAKSKVANTMAMLDRCPDIRVFTCFDKEYPARFKTLDNQKPLYIYVAGDISCLDSDTIAFIGTRKPSVYGVNATKLLIKELKETVIVSGLALGIDCAAHETAIEQGLKTVAVLPSGLCNVSPASNRQLAATIADGNGCLISEYDPEEAPQKYTFVRRDSLVAAISDGITVIECGVSSGTMHTVTAAMKMKKPLACYYTDRGGDYSGNKQLLDTGKANRLSMPSDINAFATRLHDNITVSIDQIKFDF